MVEEKQIALLFKIEKINEEVEALIPYDTVLGAYDEKEFAFKAQDGTTYYHIEEAEYPNVGYAKRTNICISTDAKEDSMFNLEYLKKQLYDHSYSCRFLRFVKQKNEIFIHDPNHEGISVLIDQDSQKLHESQNESDLNEAEETSYIGIKLTPEEIFKKVKKTVKGQDEAIRKIATCLWATINGQAYNITKKQMVLVGPTGVGKTEIFRQLQKILKIPVIIFSVPGLSQAGYVGRSTDEILKQIYYECNENIDLAEKAIVILDEYDKLAYNGSDKSGDISTVGVQNELLKMIEGYTRIVEIKDGQDQFEIDTTNMIFIATGAFQELFEEEKKEIGFHNQETKALPRKINAKSLVDYGLKRESIGRLPIIITLNSLTKEIYREIILESDKSELLAHVNFLESLGIKISNLDDIIDTLIEDAMKKDIGARGLISTISNLFVNIIYEVANNPNKYNELYIGKNIINDPNDFQLIKNKVITKSMKLNKGKRRNYR